MAFDIPCLDLHLCEEMAEHVEKITLSGQSTIDVDTMKKFKKICRISDLYIRHAYHMLMSTLENDHAEIRLSTLKMIDELFNRSHYFRELLVSEFQRFLELTVETDHDQPLPPPLPVAKKLKAETLKAIQQWHEKFGDAYKKLVLGYNFLKSCKLVDFNDIRTRTIAERKREEEKERKRKLILDQKLLKVQEEIADSVPEIETSRTEIENCLNLLLPPLDDFFISETEPVFDASTSIKPSPATDSHSSSALQSNYHTNLSTELTSNSQPQTVEHQNSQSVEHQNSQSVEHQNSQSVEHQNSSSEIISNDCTIPTCTRPTSGEPNDEVNSNDKVCSENDEPDSDCHIEEEDNEDTESASISRQDFVNDFGLGSRKYTLNIEIKPKKFLIEENEDNSDIFKTLRDSIKIVRLKFLPKVIRWLEIMAKAGAKQEQLKEIIDLKSMLDVVLNKCVEMKVTEKCEVDMDSDEEDDFEEVPEKEGYEAEVPIHLLTSAEMGLKDDRKKNKRGRKAKSKDWALASASEDIRDPTSRAANLSKFDLNDMHGASTSSSSNGQTSRITNGKNIPIIPFGPDLAHWENPEKMEKPMIIKYDSLHRFWTPSEHESEKATQHDVEALTNRTFYYPGKFTPVRWTCRAGLPNGSLCERMDRVKCPFHGKIIGRDKTGRPSNMEDAKRLLKEEAKKIENSVPDWKDPELQRDIEMTLGIDLGSSSSKNKSKGKGKGKGKNKKYANLTDIKESKNTSRSRLEKRVFNRNTMKKVTSRMDAADFKRVRDKFANQFNYAHEK